MQLDKIVTKNDMGEKVCEMIYDPNQNWIHVIWEGFANLEAIKSWGESYITLVEETACLFLLNDDSRSNGA